MTSEKPGPTGKEIEALAVGGVVEVSVTVGVGVLDEVLVGVRVAPGVLLATEGDVLVAVGGRGVLVGVLVAVGVTVAVGVLVAVTEQVGAGDSGTGVLVGVDVLVGALVAVRVGVERSEE